MKVLHVIHSSRGGGAETQLDILCRHGIACDIESVTFCVASDRELNQESRAYVRYHRNGKFDLRIVRAIADAIEEERPDVVHVWLPPIVTIPAMFSAWRAAVPVVASYRNTMAFRRALDVAEFCAILSFGTGVVSNTPQELCSRWYRWLFEAKRGEVIPNAVDLRRIGVIADASEFLGQKAFRILYVGRLTEQKNVSVLVDAMATHARQCGWRLNVCGVGPLERTLRARSQRLHVAQEVQWFGYRSDLPDLMALHDVLVLPSWYEGFPNVLLEAMAAGVPVIASDIPSHRRVVGETGAALLFAPNSPTDLVRCLREIQGDPIVRSRLIEAGSELAGAYSVHDLVIRYRTFYDGVLRGFASTGRGKSR